MISKSSLMNKIDMSGRIKSETLCSKYLILRKDSPLCKGKEMLMNERKLLPCLCNIIESRLSMSHCQPFLHRMQAVPETELVFC